jgi:hypothetical protein
LAFPALVAAQVQEPTAAELQMTADPKAPGASAVVLYREQTIDDVHGFMIYFDRVKVLTDKGKDMAIFQIPYDPDLVKVEQIQARTIHPDGSVVEMTEPVSDLLKMRAKSFNEDAIVFSLPNVQVGSILDFRMRVDFKHHLVSSPTWEIQGPLFVHRAHYSFYPGSKWGEQIVRDGEVLGQLLWTEHLGPNMKVICDKKTNCSLDVTDVPPAPIEDWMSPQNTTTWRVEFYYSNYSSASDIWREAISDWASRAVGFITPTIHLKEAVAQIVQPSDSDRLKAQKIYTEVMKLDNTSFSRTKSESERKKEKLKDIHLAEDVWTQKSGNSNEIALLYISMARAAGLKAWPMEVVNRSRALLDNQYFSTRQLDDYLAIVSIGGQEIYLDPGQKMCPFGMLHWKHTLASGFVLSEQGALVGTTPEASYKSASTQRIADLTVGPDGSVAGSVKYVFVGPAALAWRQLAIEDGEDQVTKVFNESLIPELPEGVHASLEQFSGLDDYNSKLVATMRVTGTLGIPSSKRMMLPALFFEAQVKHPFTTRDTRITPIDLQYARVEQDDVTYHLPQSYDVEFVPQATNFTWAGHAALRIEPKQNGNTLEVARTMAYNFAVLPASDYGNLHDFFQKIETADQQQVVLVQTGASK